jgi:CDP-diglyceride synthetase
MKLMRIPMLANSPDLNTRLVSGLSVVLLLIVFLVLANWFCFVRHLLTTLVAAACALCAWEFARMAQLDPGVGSKSGVSRLLDFSLVALPIVGALAVSLASGCAVDGSPIFVSAAPMVVGVAATFVSVLGCLVYAQFSCVESPKAVVSRSGAHLSALLHIGFGGACLVSLVSYGGTVYHFAWVVAVIAIGDTTAYFVGRTFGGPKLAPHISPAKTWSGSVGGLIGALLVGLLGGWFFPPVQLLTGSLSGAESVVWFVCLALVMGLSGQIGDLHESSLKRMYGVKDSGKMMPGHGGAYDRLDAILAGSAAFMVLAFASFYVL